MHIAFFGSSLVSAYWNGAATYYRGILGAMAARGHQITFLEPDAFERQQHRDIEDPQWAQVVVYENSQRGVYGALEIAGRADVVVKASGVGVFDELLEREVLALKRPQNLVLFWDVDAPATLERVQQNRDDPFAPLISQYDLVLTYGGGPRVVEAYHRLGANDCIPIYNALDPATHYPTPADPRFSASLAFLGNRLPDREARVAEFFFKPARALPQSTFLLGGSGWDQHVPELPNVHYHGHVYTPEHNAFNCTPQAVLNISRDSMFRFGFSPATRVFEAAGAGACLITDAWDGIETFLEPETEVLVAANGDQVTEHLQRLTPQRAEQIGKAARHRVLREHTYAIRAKQLDDVLQGRQQNNRTTATKVDAIGQIHHELSDGNVLMSDGPATDTDGSKPALDIVILGLSVTSSWGNGHATTFRALIRGLTQRGHKVLFLERDRPWYAAQRDQWQCDGCTIELYDSLDELREYAAAVASADLVMLGSFVPEGVAVGHWLLETAQSATAFYDIDTPVTLAKLARGDYEYLSPGLIQSFDLYLSFTGGPTLQRLEQEFGSPCARALYCAVDPELYFPEARVQSFDLGYMGTYSPDRQPILDRLLLEPARHWAAGSFAVAGPQYPTEICWPTNVKRIDHIAPDKHRAFYNSQRFTLNVTREDMTAAGYAPSVRLFEAAACGTPVISDWWEGLDEFFTPDKEILISRSADETLRYLRETKQVERDAIAAAARDKVLSQHTCQRRAEELEQYVRELIPESQIAAQAARA